MTPIPKSKPIKTLWGSPFRRTEQEKLKRWKEFVKWYQARKAEDRRVYTLGGADALIKHWETEVGK
jgi:hypothetical protein